ncbi:SRPBCC domain-containing protein [Kribbella sp. NPDC054772]
MVVPHLEGRPPPLDRRRGVGPDGALLVMHDNQGDPISGKTLAWEPPRLAEFEWNGGPTQPADSIVRFELTPEPDGTRLVLTHGRLTDQGHGLDFVSGWHYHLDTLAAVVVDAEPGSDRATWEELKSRYAASVG